MAKGDERNLIVFDSPMTKAEKRKNMLFTFIRSNEAHKSLVSAFMYFLAYFLELRLPRQFEPLKALIFIFSLSLKI